MRKRSVRDIAWQDKKALVRADLNVPLAGTRISDDTRIRASVPTLRFLLDEGAAVVLMSHLGRPKGKPAPELSLAPVAQRLQELLKRPVQMAPAPVGAEVRQLSASLPAGEVLLLENLRFDPREEANDPGFARALASLADVFVADAFGAAHRAHASTVGVAKYIPAVAGLLLQREVEVLGGVLTEPERPFVAILGGAKVSDKIAVIRNLIGKADSILLGGGMAYTFLHAQGFRVGRSLLDRERVALAAELLQEAERAGTRFVLPEDVVIAPELADDVETAVVTAGEIPDEQMGLDIGPRTAARFGALIAEAGTVIWNGPMGVFEKPPFAAGTREVAAAAAGAPGVTIIGGGDSAAAVEQFGFAQAMDHISTGGGASLEFLAGSLLPGLEVIPEEGGLGDA